MFRFRAVALALPLALMAGACGDDDDTATGDAPTADEAVTDEPATDEAVTDEPATDEAATDEAVTDEPATDEAATDEAATDEAATDEAAPSAEKPEVVIAEGDAPTELVIDDLVEGSGDEAVAGSLVSVNYVGVLFKDGTEFDNSYDRGAPFNVVVGAGRVIQGWDQGLVGMLVGGRRQLTIPASLAYGEAGQGSIGPNEPLVFVIDLLSVATPATAADADIPATEPAEITTTDLVPGDGEAIAAGQTGTFQYLVLGLDGTELDNSWVSGQPAVVELGTATIPAEIENELVGMVLGGRRQVVVPQGASEMTSEQALVFLFDLTAIG